MNIHHIAFSVVDISQMSAWYQNIFDFRVLHEYEKNGKFFCMLEKDGVRLELIHWGEKQKPVPDYRKALATDLAVGGMKHICFEVDSVEKEIKRLQDLDVEIHKELSTAGFGGQYFFASDPEGNLLEFWSKQS